MLPGSRSGTCSVSRSSLSGSYGGILNGSDTHYRVVRRRFQVGAPAIARPKERVGRVKAAKRRSAAKGSLEAPTRSRTIECRSDRRHCLQQLNKPFAYSRSVVSLFGRSNMKRRGSPFTLC